ncbi:unnamed protein product [Nyctereutes procyonoides]|uniref:Dynein light chain n=1 Tax=Nyctereutes procyonoides TaxID=34880 RepID=A0A811ZZ26_NYCPR|nr:unnamed protein product [Nyctereutes procyonoides]
MLKKYRERKKYRELHIKTEFDKKYTTTWHCIVGRNLSSYVSHETKQFIYCYLGQEAILLFLFG